MSGRHNVENAIGVGLSLTIIYSIAAAETPLEASKRLLTGRLCGDQAMKLTVPPRASFVADVRSY